MATQQTKRQGQMSMIVINLPWRHDRLAEFTRKWPVNFMVQDGITHKMPHTGCGLSHIAAIRKGLGCTSRNTVLVLEDDCDLDINFDSFCDLLETFESHSNDFDVIVFDPSHDDSSSKPIEDLSVKRVFNNCVQVEPTTRLIGCHCCLWSRRALSLLEEYENALNKYYFLPIDRMIFNNKWSSSDLETWERCIDNMFKSSKNSNHVVPMPPDLVWTPPTTWVCTDHVVKLRSSFSDHTREINKMPSVDQLMLKLRSANDIYTKQLLHQLNIRIQI